MNRSPHPAGYRAALATRLRDLRENHWPGRPVKQRELAAALGIRDSNISNWESNGGTAVPTPSRLDDIAAFFATTRSVSAEVPRLLTTELTAPERAARDALLAELTALHAVATGSAPAPSTWHPWHFPDDARIRLVCGTQPKAGRAVYADESHDNYMALTRYADLDALVELYAYLRAENPRADVQHRLVRELTRDDLQSDLVVLGNMAWMEEWALDMSDTELPVRQVPHDGLDGEIFEVRTAASEAPVTVLPRFGGTGEGRRLVEDIGLFVRRPSPLDSTRTLSWCSGVFTRGVVGAARLLADAGVGPGNLEWLSARFSTASTYGVLLRVPLPGRHVLTPDLNNPRHRIFAFLGVGDTVQVVAE